MFELEGHEMLILKAKITNEYVPKGMKCLFLEQKLHKKHEMLALRQKIIL